MTSETGDYNDLVKGLSALILRHDPLGLQQGNNVPIDEYEAEARAIVSGLSRCPDEESCLTLVWHVFREDFGEESIGPREAFAPLAHDVWTFQR